MMKSKKIFSILFALTLIFSTATSAFAASNEACIEKNSWIYVNIDEEIERALKDETDLNLNIPSEAILEKADGTDKLVQVYTTTREIATPNTMTTDSSEHGKVYATTAVAAVTMSEDKSDTDSVNDYYVTAYGTVYWRDNLGVNNEFLGASGGWDSDINPATNKKPTLSNKSATIHGQSYARDYVYKQITPTGMTYSISKSSFNYKRWEFWLTSAVTVNGKDKLNLKVSTGFLT